MPELPDLEVLRRRLREGLLESKVLDIEVLSDRALKTRYFKPAVLKKGILREVSRKGKNLILEFHSGFKLLFQPLLKGWVSFEVPGEAAPLLRLSFEGGRELYFIEYKNKGMAGLYIVRKLEGLSFMKKLGVDPLSEEFTIDYLAGAVGERKDRLKAFLVDQKIIAGVGNAYADEILWEARLSPFRICADLDESEVEELFRAVRSVLDSAISVLEEVSGEGLPPFEYREHLKVHRREGQPCPRCGAIIKAVYEGERGTFFCPECQR